MDASLVMTAARLLQCRPDEILSVRWRGERLAVVWGIGWKVFFGRAEVDALAVDAVFVPEERVQMIEIAPGDSAQSPVPSPQSLIEITPTNDTDGLSTLFPERLAVVLIRAGFGTPGAVQAATDEELRAVNGVGPRTLADIRELLPALPGSTDYVGGYVEDLAG